MRLARMLALVAVLFLASAAYAETGSRPSETIDALHAVLLDVMQSMNERKIAPIVAAMDAERARLLTQQLAERQTVPKVPK